MENHQYQPCDHEGRHGYTLRGGPEYEMCERCRRGPESHQQPLPKLSTCECGGGCRR